MSPTTYTEVLARNVRAARSRAGLQQEPLAERMRDLGYSAWLRQTVANVEKGRRGLKAEEILGLAICLETTVQRLMVPLWEDKWVDLPSGAALCVGAVVTLVTGELPAADSIPTSQELHWHGNKLARAIVAPHEMEGVSWETPAALPRAEPQPVIAAIVTSDRGVLVGRRQDGTPPWGFITGWSEPGESPPDTIIREVKEEADLRVKVGERLGERDHPDTGRHMIYYAAHPTHGTEIHVGDEAEIAEVRWVSLPEAEQLLPGMFGPVREYLAQEIGGAG